MKKRILGVDIGIASLGWALVELDDQQENPEQQKGEIIEAGVRIFTVAENPKSGESLAKPRRDARLARRRNHRRAWRMRNIKQLFVRHGLITENELETLYVAPKGEEGPVSPWILRAEAINKKLSGPELARALTHIAKRRGFKSMRKAAEKQDKKQGKLLAALDQTRQYMKDGNYETVGQMLALDQRYAEAKRNKREDYKNSIPRELSEEEVRKIFIKQRALGNTLAGIQLENDYWAVAFHQYPISGVMEKVGNCTFEKDEKRAPKRSYSAELFAVLSNINNQLILSPRKGERHFSPEERAKILELCHELHTVSYSQLRKKLAISDEWYFKGVDYSLRAAQKKHPESKEFAKMQGYHDMRDAISKKLGERSWEAIKNNAELLDSIAEGLTYEKTDESVRKYLLEHNVPQDIADAVSELHMIKFTHLSCKALRKIIPFMREGKLYSEACALAGYNHSAPGDGPKNRLLPPLTTEQKNELVNPVVRRAATQFRKVLNAIIRKHGQVDQINMELARDISHNFEDRKEIQKGQEEFKAEKDRAKERCKENG
ncbi:MAG TPA: type II CRISPR RNA-guided endonuclease Cas9, partial [Elusimicrobiales bacterium]|nr:type II CRISPR RNA-guided endonuclease Cas9 [Elusimicrobiales bacterium]